MGLPGLSVYFEWTGHEIIGREACNANIGCLVAWQGSGRQVAQPVNAEFVVDCFTFVKSFEQITIELVRK